MLHISEKPPYEKEFKTNLSFMKSYPVLSFQVTILLSLILLLGSCKKKEDNRSKGIAITIDYTTPSVPFEHFWSSTGFSPGEHLLKRDMQQTYELVGASSNLGIRYVRPHYLLNLVGVENIESGTPSYNWVKLDSVIDHLVANKSKLFFELMGTPSSSLAIAGNSFDPNYQEQLKGSGTYFDDFKDKDKLYAWRQFVKDLALHLMARYGKEEVESWYFEGTNEPDLDLFWPYDTKAYLNYYDACSEGLKAANPNLKFGGPGTAFVLSERFKAILAHCDTGTNYFTKEKGVRIDFITVHVKDKPHQMLANELAIVEYIRTNHPRFSQLPFGNDESDPTYGWNEPTWWRPTPWYASYIAQSAHLHVKKMLKANVDYFILSNDNGFMGDWYRRTHFARFQDPENPEKVALVKKPSYTVMGLLSLMGNEHITMPSLDSLSHIGVFVSKKSNGPLSLLCYNSPDIPIRVDGVLISNASDSTKNAIQKLDTTLLISLKKLPFEHPLLVEYRIDESSGNPFGVWQEMGAPELPTLDQLHELQHAEEPSISLHNLDLLDGSSTSISVDLPQSSAVLMVIGEAPSGIPEKIQGLRVSEYVGANGNIERVLRWDHIPNDGFLSYEVFYADTKNDTFKKISSKQLIDAGFVHRLPILETGAYKVRVVYVNGVKGPFSDIVIP